MMTSDHGAPHADELTAPRPTVSVAEAAALLGVSQWLVLRQLEQGHLPYRRLGRRILISRARLIAWIDETTDPGAGSATDRARPLRESIG